MPELSEEAQAMLNAVRSAHDPTDRDRKRLTGAMVAQLGAAAVISSSATLAAAGSATASGGAAAAAAGSVAGAVKVVAAVALLSFAAGTLALRTTRPRHSPLPQRVALSTSGKSASVSLPAAHPGTLLPSVSSIAPMVSTAPSVALLAPARTRAPAQAQAKPLTDPTPKSDALTKQVQVLAAARSELRQGRAELALAALDSHSELFEQGALREEYLAARVLALRALGRVPDAQAAAARFAEEMPRSALASKVGAVPTEQVEK
jgi:hypothetical protein